MFEQWTGWNLLLEENSLTKMMSRNQSDLIFDFFAGDGTISLINHPTSTFVQVPVKDHEKWASQQRNGCSVGMLQGHSSGASFIGHNMYLVKSYSNISSTIESPIYYMEI